MIEAVLFDLDGTLIDTAPDMGAALNNLLIEEGFQPLALASIRPFVSRGGLALTQLGFGQRVAEAEIEPLRLRYLQHYREIVANNSALFDGFDEVLDRLEANKLLWGIVTNKPEWLTTPLLHQLGLQQRCSVVICGDTLAVKKPHPQPLIVAAELIGVKCENCIYIGDDKRDIDAGNAANMITLSAAYGYIEQGINIAEWQADGNIEHPLDLLSHPLLFPHS
ncbi:MAG: 2-phosphoglycolate phosphatase [Gammaproteobacteria bacterium]|jgi:2-phosphoglycolate phosphatase